MNEKQNSPGSGDPRATNGPPLAAPEPGAVNELLNRRGQRESDERLALAFELSPAATAIIRRSNLLALEANEAFLRLFECGREEIIGRTLFEVGLLDVGAAHQLSQGAGSEDGVELAAHARNGKALRIRLCMRVMEAGGESCALVTVFNLTDCQQAAKASRDRDEEFRPAAQSHLEGRILDRTHQLEAANQELERIRSSGFWRLLDALPEPYLVVTPDLKIITASEAYTKATMTTLAGIVGRELFQVFPDNPEESDPTGMSNLRASFERVLSTSAPDTMAIQKYDIRRSDGVFEERYWVPTNSPVLGPDRKIEYLIHRVEDVTEFVRHQPERLAGATPLHIAQMEAKVFKSSQRLQLANRQLEASNKELEAFTYSVSHDLRAPLRGIDGYVRMLEEDYGSLLDAEGRRLIGVVSSEARRMGRLIDSLLAFSRLGRRHMEQIPVDMTGLAQAAFESVCISPTSTIRFELTPLPPAIGDLAMLRQVFFNLLSNAVKFSRNAPNPLIEVGSLSDSPTAEPLHFGESLYYVRDNGAGFDERYREKLFGVFQRLHSEAEFEGTGVGLAIVQRIVGRHGGRVWAEGRVGAGATFYFTLAKSNGADR